MVSSYILEGHNFLVKSQKCSWSISKMKSYFNLIRYINPKVTSSCEKVLQAYYKRQRSLEDRNFARTTPRLLQSLIRLAEGHARLMFRDKVLVIDAIMAIILMESSMSGSAILDGLTTLHTSFPEDPKFQYTEKKR
ncbi:DNA helicase MCM9 [Caerostris extrusa]|uniref:DNA helicase MCM9 n=1 Tax=Caerostris extrusa TaxID=172846 RepID=A0AAV4RUD6_CAEEX|nr:DNA helicase MCM9 [Caerostris extrusa]